MVNYSLKMTIQQIRIIIIKMLTAKPCRNQNIINIRPFFVEFENVDLYMYCNNSDRIKSTQWQDHILGKSTNCFILKGAQYIYMYIYVLVCSADTRYTRAHIKLFVWRDNKKKHCFFSYLYKIMKKNVMTSVHTLNLIFAIHIKLFHLILHALYPPSLNFWKITFSRITP